MKSVLYILFATILTYVVSLCAGKLILQRCRVTLYRSEERFIGFVLGASCLSLLVFLLTAAHLAYKGTFLVAGLAIVALAVRFGAHRLSQQRLTPLTGRQQALFAIPFLVYSWVYLSNALAPEVSSDGTAYHVALVARYYREHHFPAITTNMYASLSEGLEMLFLYAFAFGKHSGAAMVHYLFLLTLPFGLWSYARRLGEANAGLIAAILFYLAPAIGKDGTSGYIDIGLAATIFAVFYLVQIWRETREDKLWIPIGLLGGFAYAIKYTGALAIPYALGVVLWTQWRAGRSWWRPAVLITGCALVMMAPWMIKNAVVVGNPFSPFANRIFPNHFIYASFEQQYRAMMAHYNGMENWREIPYGLTIRGGKLQGLYGPIFLLTPLMLLGLRYRLGRQVLPAALLFALTYPANVGTRFLIPVIPFVSLGLGVVFAHWRGMTAFIILAQAITCWPGIVRLYGDPYLWMVERPQWKAALRREAEADFLRSHLGDYEMGLLIEKFVPAGQPVFVAGSLQQAYHSREAIIAYQSAFGNRIQGMMWTAFMDIHQPTWRHEFVFPTQKIQHLRVVQTGTSEIDEWTVTEFRLYHQDQELARDPRWRLRASDNTWDVPLAFDNSPVTKYRSGDFHRPGMFVEVDLGRPEQLDRVLLDCPHAQGTMNMRLEIQDQGGNWRTLVAEPKRIDIPPPPRLRRAAVEEMKAQGLHWFVAHDDDIGGKDYLERANQWGMKPVVGRNGLKLYHLE